MYIIHTSLYNIYSSVARPFHINIWQAATKGKKKKKKVYKQIKMKGCLLAIHMQMSKSLFFSYQNFIFSSKT